MGEGQTRSSSKGWTLTLMDDPGGLGDVHRGRVGESSDSKCQSIMEQMPPGPVCIGRASVRVCVCWL